MSLKLLSFGLKVIFTESYDGLTLPIKNLILTNSIYLATQTLSTLRTNISPSLYGPCQSCPKIVEGYLPPSSLIEQSCGKNVLDDFHGWLYLANAQL